VSLIEMGLRTATMAASEAFTFTATSIQLAAFFVFWLACEYVRVETSQ
jgi:hypothetical protein